MLLHSLTFCVSKELQSNVTFMQVPLMDRLGRRPLLLVPMVVMVLILALITIALKLQVSFDCVADMLYGVVHLLYYWCCYMT